MGLQKVSSGFEFQYKKYFFRTEFGNISLFLRNIILFTSGTLSLGFELLYGYNEALKKHRLRFEKWDCPENHPSTKKELDDFL